MKRKIFISTSIPDNIKAMLLEYQKNHYDLPVKWIKKDKIHISLLFLGYLDDNLLSLVCDCIETVIHENKPFIIKMDKICYFPFQKIPPQMIWAISHESKEFINLKKELEESLSQNIPFSPKKGDFFPHVALGRIRKWEWKKINPEERPQVEQDISKSIEVNSIELMEGSARGYSILKSFPL